ncbi:MAG: hypothetical protein NT069_11775 [Planctomycetota bacterium]|nr:hypothetical protein [Planctomycetota bacterium]
MRANLDKIRTVWLVVFALFLGSSLEAQAHGPFYFGFMEQIQNVKDPAKARELNLKVYRTAGGDIFSGGCAVCHLGGRGGSPRNVYGNALNTFLSFADYNTPGRISEAARRVMDIPANPSLPDSPTFGELINEGEFPVPIFSRAVPTVRRKGSPPAAERITVEEARKRVKQVEAESRFGILQLSMTDEISPEVAATLAEFRGEYLVLGIRSLTPEVAVALARSQAANVWLHNLTSVTPEAGDAIVQLPGHLVLTGLAELTSPALAEKLAKRPGALSLPYVKTITLPIAVALVQHEGSLTLGGLTTVASEIQDKLAEAKVINLPGLKSLDSAELTKKFAENWRIFLPDVDRLTVPQAKLFADTKGQKFLSAAAMTEEVAGQFSQSVNATSIALFGAGPISDTAFEALLKTRYAALELRDIESPTPGQIQVMAEAKRSAFFPQLKRLDSVPLAKLLASGTLPSVTYISPEVADALGKLPEGIRTEQNGTTRSIPSGSLTLPSLEELPPETLRLLLQRRWWDLSFPAFRDYSVETIRLLGRQTASSLTLGFTSLPPELASAFDDMPLNPQGLDRWVMFPFLSDLPPESARILVKTLNQGIKQVAPRVRITRTPQLFIGGTAGSPTTGFSTISPELAVELASYEGILAISGLRELPAESAELLSTFPGPNLRLSGPATYKLPRETSTALAKIPGNLFVEELRVLDSVPLCDKAVREFGMNFNRVEIVVPESVTAIIKLQQWFNLDGLTVLDSPALARRLLEPPHTGGRNLHALQRLTPEAAVVLATYDKPLRLGLSMLDDVAVARALARSKGKIELKRLRAATPEVIAILKDAKAIEVPNLESLYVLADLNG